MDYYLFRKEKLKLTKILLILLDIKNSIDRVTWRGKILKSILNFKIKSTNSLLNFNILVLGDGSRII